MLSRSVWALVTCAVGICSQFDQYIAWLDSFMTGCGSGSWFDNCDWVTCECVNLALSVPVPNSEVAQCFEQGMKLQKVTREHQQFTFALMQTCYGKTEELGKPCGTCDKFRSERIECLQADSLVSFIENNTAEDIQPSANIQDKASAATVALSVVLIFLLVGTAP
mmetsp:Transcript_56692/g.124296  ORF Transcript_56692/g.124296 Transcript_56692/m.124296 type:complete len:165 (+) Transcript_56692:34-528(+)